MTKFRMYTFAIAFLATSLTVSGCKSAEKGDGAPPPAHVVQVQDMNLTHGRQQGC